MWTDHKVHLHLMYGQCRYVPFGNMKLSGPPMNTFERFVFLLKYKLDDMQERRDSTSRDTGISTSQTVHNPSDPHLQRRGVNSRLLILTKTNELNPFVFVKNRSHNITDSSLNIIWNDSTGFYLYRHHQQWHIQLSAVQFVYVNDAFFQI